MNISRSLLLFCLALTLLAGCSRHSVITIDTDVLSFMAEADRSGSLSPAVTEYLIPDADGLEAGELGFPIQFLETLQELKLTLGAVITSSAASGNEQVTAAFHISDSVETSPFAVPAFASTTVALAPGATERLDLVGTVNDLENESLLETLRSGDFRLGVRLEYTGGTTPTGVDYVLDAVGISISSRPGEFGFF